MMFRTNSRVTRAVRLEAGLRYFPPSMELMRRLEYLHLHLLRLQRERERMVLAGWIK